MLIDCFWICIVLIATILPACLGDKKLKKYQRYIKKSDPVNDELETD